jgi:hypothetical protein
MSGYSPVEETTERGYHFDATSQLWKDTCAPYPCFDAMQWTNYPAASLDVEIAGEKAVIQVWKGLCPQLIPPFDLGEPYGRIAFPGGFGAEVGIYRRLTQPPEGILNLDAPIAAASDWPVRLRIAAEAWIKARILAIDYANPGQLWYPADDLIKKSGLPVKMRMSDPNYSQFLISRYETGTYWTCKWMRAHSYCDWARDVQQGEVLLPEFNLPGMSLPTYYRLEFSVDGTDYVWDGPDGIRPATTPIDWEATEPPVRAI